MRSLNPGFVLLCMLAMGCQHAPKTAYGNFLGAQNGPRQPAGDINASTWNDYGGLRSENRMGEKFSPLEQINVRNVKKLKKLWVYNTGEANLPGPKSMEVTPVYANGRLYGCSIFNKVFALDAETGHEIWSFDPHIRKSDKVWGYKCRGVALWTDSKQAGQVCATRVISNTLDGRVLALDADSGERCPDFTDHINGQPVAGAAVGEVAAWVNVMSPYRESDRIAFITKQKDHEFRDEYYPTSAPLIYKDLIILGGGIIDNGRIDATSGAIQAFDVRTGEQKWAWDTAPVGLKPAGQPLTYGTPNSWGPMTADDSRGLIFMPTGGAGPDYYGALRGGKDQYADSVIALRVEENGVLLAQPRVEWQFKAVIEDKWDYDVAAQPMLTELQVDGHALPVVIQATKMGFIYILNRETGQPVFPTHAGIFKGTYKDLLREVSTNGLVPEEKLIASKDDFVTETSDGKAMYQVNSSGSHSRFQPFPPAEWQLHDTPATKKELMGLLAETSGACRGMTNKYIYEGPFTPPSLAGGINFPGAVGGVDWGGVTVDPVNQILFVNLIRIATVAQMLDRDAYKKAMAAGGGDAGPKEFKEAFFDMDGTPYGLHRFPYMDPVSRLPCSVPPYGVLKAVSLKDGKVLWQKVFGSFAELNKELGAEKSQAVSAANHEKSIMSQVMGTVSQDAANLGSLAVAEAYNSHAGLPNFGGSLATKGGILFIAAAADSIFRMYDLKSGQLINQIHLDQFQGAGSGAATPMTFMSAKNRQIVVLASGGNHYIPGRTGDALVAFALEEQP